MIGTHIGPWHRHHCNIEARGQPVAVSCPAGICTFAIDVTEHVGHWVEWFETAAGGSWQLEFKTVFVTTEGEGEWDSQWDRVRHRVRQGVKHDQKFTINWWQNKSVQQSLNEDQPCHCSDIQKVFDYHNRLDRKEGSPRSCAEVLPSSSVWSKLYPFHSWTDPSGHGGMRSDWLCLAIIYADGPGSPAIPTIPFCPGSPSRPGGPLTATT